MAGGSSGQLCPCEHTGVASREAGPGWSVGRAGVSSCLCQAGYVSKPEKYPGRGTPWVQGIQRQGQGESLQKTGESSR